MHVQSWPEIAQESTQKVRCWSPQQLWEMHLTQATPGRLALVEKDEVGAVFPECHLRYLGGAGRGMPYAASLDPDSLLLVH